MATKPGETSHFPIWMLGCVAGLCLCSCGRPFVPQEPTQAAPAVQDAVTATAMRAVTQTAQLIPAEAIAAQAIALATEVARPTATPDPRVLNPENQHLYLFVGEPFSWHLARDHCTSRGGYLVTIESVSENSFVFQLMADVGWLGATDEIQEGTWAWVTGAPWQFTNWGEGEPNNWRGPVTGEDYLSLERSGVWNDQPLENRNRFLCEWDPVSP